jgi:hypothetical protein
MYVFGSQWAPVAGSCVHFNEPMGCIKSVEFLWLLEHKWLKRSLLKWVTYNSVLTKLDTGCTRNDLFEIHSFKCFGANWSVEPAASVLVVFCICTFVDVFLLRWSAWAHKLPYPMRILCGDRTTLPEHSFRLTFSEAALWSLTLFAFVLASQRWILESRFFPHAALIWFSTRVSFFYVCNGSVRSKYWGVVITLRVFCESGMNSSTMTH